MHGIILPLRLLWSVRSWNWPSGNLYCALTNNETAPELTILNLWTSELFHILRVKGNAPTLSFPPRFDVEKMRKRALAQAEEKLSHILASLQRDLFGVAAVDGTVVYVKHSLAETGESACTLSHAGHRGIR